MFNFTGRPDTGSSSEQPRAYKSGPRQGSTAAPSYAELRNPTLVTSSISLDTNVTTSVPLMVRPWVDGWEKKMNQGSILFVYESPSAREMQTVLDLPTLNYILELSKVGLGKEKLKEFRLEDTTFENFKYNFFGILRNDLLADSTLQKLFNVDVFGRAMVANIFGSKVKRSDHVGLALVEVEAKKMHQVFYNPSGAVEVANPVNRNEKILQVVGTLNGKINSELVGTDAKIIRRYPLGVVSHAVARGVQSSKRALRNQDLFTLLPRIEILMI